MVSNYILIICLSKNYNLLFTNGTDHACKYVMSSGIVICVYTAMNRYQTGHFFWKLLPPLL